MTNPAKNKHMKSGTTKEIEKKKTDGRGIAKKGIDLKMNETISNAAVR